MRIYPRDIRDLEAFSTSTIKFNISEPNMLIGSETRGKFKFILMQKSRSISRFDFKTNINKKREEKISIIHRKDLDLMITAMESLQRNHQRLQTFLLQEKEQMTQRNLSLKSTKTNYRKANQVYI